MGQCEHTVIIPAYNAERWIERSILSVLNQEVNNVDLVVVDDGSTDQTRDVCRGFPQVRYFQQSRCGVSAARNLGIRHAKGRFINFLDADDEYLPGRLSTLAGICNAEKGKPVVSCAYFEDDGTNRVRRPDKEKVREIQLNYYQCARFHPHIASVNTVLVPYYMITQVGGFNERLYFGEDLEFWNRLYGRYSWRYLDYEGAVYHREAGNSFTCQMPFYKHPLDYVWSDQQMLQFCSKDKQNDYRVWRRDLLLDKARLAFYSRSFAFTCMALSQIGSCPLSTRLIKWICVGLMLRLFNCKGTK